MNDAIVWIVLPALAVLGIVVYFALWMWVNYRARPEPRVEVEHEGADENYGDDLHGWNTDEQVPVLMSHADYIAAGKHHELPTGPVWPALKAAPAPEPTGELDLIAYAAGGAFQPVPYAVEGEVVEESDPLTVPADAQVDARIFDDVLQSWDSSLDVEWRPSWASFTGYWETIRPARGELVSAS